MSGAVDRAQLSAVRRLLYEWLGHLLDERIGPRRRRWRLLQRTARHRH